MRAVTVPRGGLGWGVEHWLGWLLEATDVLGLVSD